MKDVEIFEDERASTYDERIRDMIPNYDYLMESMPLYLHHRLKNKENPKLLVGGCGTGNETKAFAESEIPWQITGVDPSPDMVGIARKRLGRFKNIKLVVGQVKGLPTGILYDAATLSLVLHFLPDDGAKLSLLKDVARRLKKGAPFLVVDIFGSKEEVHQNTDLQKSRMLGKYDKQTIDAYIYKVREEIQYVEEKRFFELMQEAGFTKPIRYHQSLIFGAWLCERSNISVY